MSKQSPLITVLMPTADRPEYVDRALAYLKRNYTNQTVARFRMLDGSQDEAAAFNEQACKSIDMEYYRFPVVMLPYERIHAGLMQVKTPLVALLPDDDFFNPDGFFRAVEFLMTHPDYSTVHGGYIGFRVQQAGTTLQWWNGYKRNRSFEHSDSLERLFAYFGEYTPVHYAIHRTPLLQAGFTEVLAHVDPLEYKFAEYLIAAIVLSQGKARMLDALYMARQADNSTSYERTTMAQQMFDPRFSDRYQRFKRCLMRYLAQSGLNDEQLDAAVDAIFGHYLGTWLRSHYLKNRLTGIRRRVSPTILPQHQQGGTPSSTLQQPAAKTEQKKNLRYYYQKTRQALRHPKSLIPKPQRIYTRKYAPVLDYLYAYLDDAKKTGLNLEISNSAAKR